MYHTIRRRNSVSTFFSIRNTLISLGVILSAIGFSYLISTSNTYYGFDMEAVSTCYFLGLFLGIVAKGSGIKVNLNETPWFITGRPYAARRYSTITNENKNIQIIVRSIILLLGLFLFYKLSILALFPIFTTGTMLGFFISYGGMKRKIKE